ncbi:transcriptional regulator, XRE family with cupin sensor [Anaerobranca californiensis DSM 14826]|jgi:transcriptional regulator with XRE-family HTH domain|uniref:Transcriptional regulator, XRE family with cupin sensor n=1 Tax=Anaerobranca californiensis DSM 14826 TaxID=1120989 RepID=A0A1M6MWY3_9FIRM|nr:cupin domain-containing protein [Anaerobranca californiensis]SHJ87783.1 transcriptional regulator, XRE family with cupin sensor [Anaerobranca californiensis DSM 14826]
MDIGKKLKQMRIDKGLTQEDVALRCELSKGFISQVERNLTSPSIVTLQDILECLGSDLKTFFSEEKEEKIVFKPEDIFETDNENLKFNVKWLVPNAQKNIMEPILLTIEPGGSYHQEAAHEGEEFGYVLSGVININYRDKKYRCKKGESFYFKSNTNHQIVNGGKTEAKVLWISSPPSF